MHTPGPWIIDWGNGKSIAIEDPLNRVRNGYLVAIPVWLPPDERAANARLIAAAPQMLLALQRLTRPDDGRGPTDEDLAYALDVIRAATGER